MIAAANLVTEIGQRSLMRLGRMMPGRPAGVPLSRRSCNTTCQHCLDRRTRQSEATEFPLARPSSYMGVLARTQWDALACSHGTRRMEGSEDGSALRAFGANARRQVREQWCASAIDKEVAIDRAPCARRRLRISRPKVRTGALSEGPTFAEL